MLGDGAIRGPPASCAVSAVKLLRVLRVTSWRLSASLSTRKLVVSLRCRGRPARMPLRRAAHGVCECDMSALRQGGAEADAPPGMA